MSDIEIAFLITFMAGISTLIGLFPIFFRFKNENDIVCGALAFAGGVMFSVSITDLIPESISMLSKNLIGIFVVLISFLCVLMGIVLSSFISKYIDNNNYSVNSNLYKVGLISMLAIIIHNIPEGIVTFISTTKNINLGISLGIAIALHNIPEGISISVPIYYSTKSLLKSVGYTLISALSEPLGAVIAYLFLARFINDVILGMIFSLIAGIMIQITFNSLLPTSANYKKKKLTAFFFLIGIIFMIIKCVFF